MKGKEKLQLALTHKSGPVPIDFGATAATGINCSVVEKLRDIYGLENRPVTIHEPNQMLGRIDDDLIDAMGIDIVGIMPRKTLFGFTLDSWKEWITPWGQEVLVPGNFNFVVLTTGYFEKTTSPLK